MVINQYQQENTARNSKELANDAVFAAHSRLLVECANKIIAKQGRRFIVDDNNRDVLRFLLYYFNGCDKALEIFPNKGYSLDKQILLCGGVGTGKTLIMDAFASYLAITKNPRRFTAYSVTEMLNYYQLHNSLDPYTYNAGCNKGRMSPYAICMNDLGVETHKHYGVDLKALIDEFLHARNEIWVYEDKKTHITTNLTTAEMKAYFADGYKRLEDRFKAYNVIPLLGGSRR